MDKYKDNFNIFTDGSKTETGQIESPYYIPEIKMEKLRITDQSSVFTAELIAIEEALKLLFSKKIKEPVIIFTDSLSSVEAIQSQTSNSKPNFIIRIMKLLRSLYLENCSVTYVWIPSHVGIKGNEIADPLHKEATSHSTIDIVVSMELKDAYNDIDNYIADLWQKDYDSQTTGLHYRTLVPMVNNKIKILNKYKRSKERLITRLRLGHCRLNHLFKIGQHPTGKCEHCNTQETITHFLFECKYYSIAAQMGNLMNTGDKDLPKTVQELLSNRLFDHALYNTIRNTDRNL